MGQVLVHPLPVETRTAEIVVEAKCDLACIARFRKEGLIRVHRQQKSNIRFRWTLSVNLDQKHIVLNTVLAQGGCLF